MRRAALSLLVFLLAGLGCSGRLKSWQPKGAPQELSAKTEDKIFVIPTNVQLSSGDPERLSRIFGDSIIEGFGAQAIQGSQERKKQLQDQGLSALSTSFAQTIVDGALNHNDPNHFYSFDSYTMTQIGGLLTLLQSEGAQVRYFVAAQVAARPLPWPASWFRQKKSINLEVMGAVYDVQKNMVVVAVDFFRQVPINEMEANLTSLGKDLTRILICPTREKDCQTPK